MRLGELPEDLDISDVLYVELDVLVRKSLLQAQPPVWQDDEERKFVSITVKPLLIYWEFLFF